jgi:energy-coupling factor transporter transmembrane protein EcfT
MLPVAPDRAGWPVSAAWVIMLWCGLETVLGKRWLRRVLPVLTGLVGCLLAFLWFGTDHADTRYNLNLLWAFPLQLIGPGLASKAPQWKRHLGRAMGFAAGGTALLSMSEFTISMQAFHPAVLPLGLAVCLCFEPWRKIQAS